MLLPGYPQVDPSTQTMPEVIPGTLLIRSTPLDLEYFSEDKHLMLETGRFQNDSSINMNGTVEIN